jgi:hypothetical protein
LGLFKLAGRTSAVTSCLRANSRKGQLCSGGSPGLNCCMDVGHYEDGIGGGKQPVHDGATRLARCSNNCDLHDDNCTMA